MRKIMHMDKEYAGYEEVAQMTMVEAETGTSETSRLISPKVLHDYVGEEVASISEASIISQDTVENTSVGDITFYKFNNGMKAMAFSSSNASNTTLTMSVIPSDYKPTITQKFFGHTWSPRYPRIVEIKNSGDITVFPCDWSTTGAVLCIAYI